MTINVNTDANNNINIEVQGGLGNASVNLESQSQAINAIGTTALYGPQGPKGEDGRDGVDGQDGQDGFSPIASVSKTGGTATITITDKNGTTTAQITDGQDGADGQDGQDGEAATISVGTVSSGTIASVTNSGTSSAAVFDFVLPKGDTGNTGATGADGQDGFSPTATVTKSGDTATITITDKNGTTTANISDGAGASSISQLTDVNLTGLSNGDTLIYNSTSQEWEAGSGGGGPITVDQTYDGTSVNAQSGVAIAGELANYQDKLTFSTGLTNTSGTITVTDYSKLLKNTATGSNSITIDGSATAKTYAVNLGKSSEASGAYGTALGGGAYANATYTVAVGYCARVTAGSSIQLGYGTTTTTNQLYVGFYNANKNWNLLDGTTGLIPRARLPLATSSTTGTVQPDNSTITIDANGVITSNVLTRNIGEIVQSTIPLTDAGLHLLDGALLAYGSYGDFIDYIADLYDSGNYDDIFDTEANWQSAVTTYGVCGKFVYDSVNSTVRLPKITGFAEGTIDPTVLGDLVQAGLPNITGILASRSSGSLTYGAIVGGDGCFSVSSKSSTSSDYNYISTTSSTGKVDRAYFDASSSNSIYGNSNTVQPQAIKVLYYIVVATTTKTAIQVDIDEIATDLNGKADVDLLNINSSCKPIDGQWVPSELSIASNVSMSTSTDLEYDISNYLPNDNYNYEVMIRATGYSGSTSGNVISMYVYSDITLLICLMNSITRTSSSAWGGGNAIVPVGTGRLIKIHTDGAGAKLDNLRAVGYRRIGTNS